jgi:cysteine-rich repeat protein
VSLAVVAGAQDRQVIALGNGFPGSECVLAGPNAVLDSTPAGDDRLFGNTILSGQNGICETPLGGDDVRSDNGVVLNQGVPNARLIVPGAADGICRDTIVPAGDDVVRVVAGQSEPRMIAVRAGSNGTIESVAAGDDLATALICAGADGVIDSTPAGDGQIAVSNVLCATLCAQPFACVVPGADGLLQTGVHPADESKPYVSSGADGIAQTAAAGDDVQVIAPGNGFADTVCVDAGADGLAQTTLCGNGVADADENGIPGSANECEDGNTTPGDGCNAICEQEFCGDGVTQPTLGEECDDGNTRNNDACVLGCKTAVCGDGFIQRGVEDCEPPNTEGCDAACRQIIPPGCGNGIPEAGEDCDDGSACNLDDCLTTCLLATCGDGFVRSKGAGPFEECDDGNTSPGDGCNPTCGRECGNGAIDGACSEGTVGAACMVATDCDTAPSAGDGVCIAEACDPGAAALCVPGPEICSNACRPLECGNGDLECDEQCDLGTANGDPGSSCTATCTSRVIGAREGRSTECPMAWTLDAAPRDLARTSQICRDGDPCDFDAIPGQCTFRVGICLNRPGVPGCVRTGIETFELRGLRVDQQPAVIEALTAAVASLAPGTALVPDRCREGLRGKICAIPENIQCDSRFGARDGVCDIGTGILFTPALEPADLAGAQAATCTPGVDVVVPVGGRLNLGARVRSTTGRPDGDRIRVACVS